MPTAIDKWREEQRSPSRTWRGAAASEHPPTRQQTCPRVGLGPGTVRHWIACGGPELRRRIRPGPARPAGTPAPAAGHISAAGWDLTIYMQRVVVVGRIGRHGDATVPCGGLPCPDSNRRPPRCLHNPLTSVDRRSLTGEPSKSGRLRDTLPSLMSRAAARRLVATCCLDAGRMEGPRGRLTQDLESESVVSHGPGRGWRIRTKSR